MSSKERASIEELISQLTFCADKYVNQQVALCPTVDKVLQHKQIILQIQETTNQELKKNVYENYKRFIDTAKEISHVANEMHQLREMLNNQEQLMHSMTNLSIVQHKGLKLNEHLSELDLDVVDSKTSGNDEVQKRTENLSFLLERVEGSARLLDGNEKSLLKEGQAHLIGRNESSKVLLCLLTDSLLVADCLPVKRGTIQYRLRWAFELDSLAAVEGQLALQIKLLVFPQTILLQLESVQEKAAWTAAIEQAKYKKLTRQAVANARLHYPSLGIVMDQTDSVDEDVALPDWLTEAPDDLDVFIAERNFKEAVALLLKIQEYWPSLEGYTSSSAREVKLRIDNRQEDLIKVLSDELTVKPTAQCGPRAAKKAVGFLIELGQTCKASFLFLEHREALLRTATKNQSQHSEGAMDVYARRICNVFFSHLGETSRQFQKAFIPSNAAISSALVSWCCSQISWFVNLLSKQLFSSQTPLMVIAEAVQLCTRACAQLQEIGLDLGFVLKRNLRNEIERCIVDGKDKLLEAIKHRSSEDAWKPQKIDSGWQQSLERFGIDIGPYVYDDNMTYLTSNSVAFTKSFLQFVNDLICLYTPPLHRLIGDCAGEALTAHRRHIENSLSGTKLKSDQKFIQRNEAFILNDVRQATEKLCSSPEGLLLWPEIKVSFENQHKF